MFGLKMEIMACAGLVGGTKDQRYLFNDLILLYQLYEVLPKMSPSHLSPATAILVVYCCQLGPSVYATVGVIGSGGIN